MSRKSNLPILNVLLLLAVSLVTSACFWSGPWPHVTANMEALGTSPLGNFIRTYPGDGPDGYKSLVTQFVKDNTSANGISREEAEDLGMKCAPAPSTECTYSGELWTRSDGLPPTSPYYKTRNLKRIKVRFSYVKPHAVVVEASLQVVPDE